MTKEKTTSGFKDRNHLWCSKYPSHETARYAFHVSSDKNPKGGFFSPKVGIKVTYQKKDGSQTDPRYVDVQGRAALLDLREQINKALELEDVQNSDKLSSVVGIMIPDTEGVAVNEQ